MSGSRVSAGTHPAGATAYTVIRKSGQRGMEFTDPRLAAMAFLEAQGRIIHLYCDIVAARQASSCQPGLE